MRRAIPAFILLCGLLLGSVGGCKKENCEALTTLACEHVERRKNGDLICERLKHDVEAVEDETCEKTLRVLKESGKLQPVKR